MKNSFFVTFLSQIFILFLLLQPGCSEDGSGTLDDTGSDSDTDSDTFSECESLNITTSLSKVIGTVGIVEWSVDGIIPSDAYIEFGLDESYGMQAPVDLEEPNYRTLLLGMKPSSEYHFRVVLDDGEKTIKSCDQDLTTGPGPNGYPTHNINTFSESSLGGGYTLLVFFTNCETFILDEDGDFVWWYRPDMTKCSRARMSYNGKHMLIRNVNIDAPEGVVPSKGEITRVSMDGLIEETFYLACSHHDFTVLPDGAIGYIDHDGASCDNIMEMDAKGEIKQIFHLADGITPQDSVNGCHTNSINYRPIDDSYTVSVLTQNLFVKVSRSGELRWVFGGEENDFTGIDFVWENQHGHHLYDDRILFFNNGGATESSMVLAYSLDESNLEASLEWQYSSKYGSNTFGDVQHLSNGNILVTYSNDGVIHEVDPKGNLLQEIIWGQGSSLGYAMRRDSLYGPPPKY